MSDTKRTFAWAVIGLLVGLLAAAVLSVPVVTAQIRATQVENTAKNDARDETLEVVKRIAKRIESCTTPGKPCSKRGERRTARAVGDIGNLVVLAAACASGLPYDLSTDARIREITKCMTVRMADDN